MESLDLPIKLDIPMPEASLRAKSAAVTAIDESPAFAGPQLVLSKLEQGRYCAYNLTRERFLSPDIEAADFSAPILESRLRALTPESPGALWIAPFRGISPSSVRSPIDLVYLSSKNFVLAVVESYPLKPLPPSGVSVASVLALPAHSIVAAETKAGDRLILCPPHEIEPRLQGLQAAKAEQSVTETAPASPSISAKPVQIAPANGKASKGWLQRLFAKKPQDPRKEPRAAIKGLVAYFFTGGTPVPHDIRDISGKGLYVFTGERWYIGTVIRITLTDRHQPSRERSLTVDARVIRWGHDGVGLRFQLRDVKDPRRSAVSFTDAITASVGSADIEQFLDLLRADPP
jgi:uncharacterized protein